MGRPSRFGSWAVARWALLACAACALPAAAVQDAELQQAQALEKTVQRVIANAEPSIACLFVSRSDLYARFGQGPAADKPGKLGALDFAALQSHPLFGELSAADKKALLRKLDLADPAQVPESSGPRWVNVSVMRVTSATNSDSTSASIFQ